MPLLSEVSIAFFCTSKMEVLISEPFFKKIFASPICANIEVLTVIKEINIVNSLFLINCLSLPANAHAQRRRAKRGNPQPAGGGASAGVPGWAALLLQGQHFGLPIALVPHRAVETLAPNGYEMALQKTLQPP